MRLSPVTNIKDPALEVIKSLYENSFPLPERRLWEEVLKLLNEPRMKFCSIAELEQIVGFLIYWEFGRYVYVEHLAIEDHHRGKQIGHRVMKHLIQFPGTKLVLETELPTNENAARRITFYKRLGLQELQYDYEQPPYRINDTPFPMLLMSSGEIDFEEFEELAALLKQEVYEKFY